VKKKRKPKKRGLEKEKPKVAEQETQLSTQGLWK
jgi:hypothetical protein